MKPEAWRVEDVEVLTDQGVERLDGVTWRGDLAGIFAIVDADPNDPERPPGRYWIMLFGRQFMSTDDKASAFAAVEAIADLVEWDPLGMDLSDGLGERIAAAVATIPVWMGPHPSAAMIRKLHLVG